MGCLFRQGLPCQETDGEGLRQGLGGVGAVKRQVGWGGGTPPSRLFHPPASFPSVCQARALCQEEIERLSYLCHRLCIPQQASQSHPRRPELHLAHKRTQKGSPPFLDLIFTETGVSFPAYLKTFDFLRAPHLTNGRTSLGLNQALSMMKICTVPSVV